MRYNLKNILTHFYSKDKNKIIDYCFGFLLLVNLVIVPILVRKITFTLQNYPNKNIDLLSSVWYEQSREAMIFFEQQSINIILACAIMASLLYGKYRKLAFLCLFIPTFYIIAQRLI